MQSRASPYTLPFDAKIDPALMARLAHGSPPDGARRCRRHRRRTAPPAAEAPPRPPIAACLDFSPTCQRRSSLPRRPAGSMRRPAPSLARPASVTAITGTIAASAPGRLRCAGFDHGWIHARPSSRSAPLSPRLQGFDGCARRRGAHPGATVGLPTFAVAASRSSRHLRHRDRRPGCEVSFRRRRGDTARAEDSKASRAASSDHSAPRRRAAAATRSRPSVRLRLRRRRLLRAARVRGTTRAASSSGPSRPRAPTRARGATVTGVQPGRARSSRANPCARSLLPKSIQSAWPRGSARSSNEPVVRRPTPVTSRRGAIELLRALDDEARALRRRTSAAIEVAAKSR